MDVKRTVDVISIDELELLIAAKKREAHQKSVKRMQQMGRVIEVSHLNSQMTNETRMDRTTQKSAPVANVNDKYKDQKGNDQDNYIWFKTTNFALFFAEIAIVIALVFIGVAMYSGIRDLQQQTADTQGNIDGSQRHHA